MEEELSEEMVIFLEKTEKFISKENNIAYKFDIYREPEKLPIEVVLVAKNLPSAIEILKLKHVTTPFTFNVNEITDDEARKIANLEDYESRWRYLQS